MPTVQQRVIDVTARVLHLDPAEVTPENTFTTDLGAESVQSVELVAMFEEEFGIEMDEDRGPLGANRRRRREVHRRGLQETGSRVLTTR